MEWSSNKKTPSLPKRRLGKTELDVSVISLGGVGLGGTEPGDLYGGITDD